MRIAGRVSPPVCHDCRVTTAAVSLPPAELRARSPADSTDTPLELLSSRGIFQVQNSRLELLLEQSAEKIKPGSHPPTTQRPSQWLNEELVNMHEGRTLPFTSVTSPDALAQRKMERNGKNLSQGCCTAPIQ